MGPKRQRPTSAPPGGERFGDKCARGRKDDMTIDERAMARCMHADNAKATKKTCTLRSISHKIGKEMRGSWRKGPSEAALSRLFSKKSWQDPQGPNKPGQGRPDKVLPASLKKLAPLVDKLQKKANTDKHAEEVPAHVILEHWKPQLRDGEKPVTPAHVSALLRKLGLPWQPFPTGLPIGEEQAAARSRA